MSNSVSFCGREEMLVKPTENVAKKVSKAFQENILFNQRTPFIEKAEKLPEYYPPTMPFANCKGIERLNAVKSTGAIDAYGKNPPPSWN